MKQIMFRQRSRNKGNNHYWGYIDGEWVMPLLSQNYENPQESDQYTGYKDKNGIEIYESDIVKDEYRSKYFIVFWDNGFFLNDATDTAWSVQHLHKYYCEVLGNTHENHELLKRV